MGHGKYTSQPTLESWWQARTFMFEGDQEFVERLEKKYQRDFKAMARDIKLNPYQHTPAQLKASYMSLLFIGFSFSFSKASYISLFLLLILNIVLKVSVNSNDVAV